MHTFTGMLYRLAEAFRLQHRNQASGALASLEAAIDGALMNGPTILLGIAYEQAGKLTKQLTGSDRLSQVFLKCAFQTYSDYGATAKCKYMTDIYPTLVEMTAAMPSAFTLPSPSGLAGSMPSGSQSGSSGTTSVAASDNVDLATLLSAVSTWQREKSAPRVAASLVSILIKSMVSS